MPEVDLAPTPNVENSTSFRFDTYEWEEDMEGISTLRYYEYIVTVCFPIGIVFGIFFNCVILIVTCRFCLWRIDHGYLYIAAISSVNSAILVFDFGTVFLATSGINFNIMKASQFTCRVWPFFMHVLVANGWLVAALLINVYLREQLRQRTTCGCPRYAAKYCTLARTKVVIAVIFGANFILSVHCLWTFELYENGFDSSNAFRWMCHPSYNNDFIMFVQIASFYLSFAFMLFVPVAIVLPVFLILTNCLRRRDASFRFSQIDGRSRDSEEMTKAVLWLSGTVWLTQCPTLVSHFVRITVDYDTNMILLAVAHVVHCLSFSGQPILCLIMLTRLKEPWLSYLRGTLCFRKWCPMFVRQNNVESAELEEAEDVSGGRSIVHLNDEETVRLDVALEEQDDGT